MELQLKNTTLSLAGGVDANKFVANRAIATIPSEVKKVFLNHGYNLDEMNGVFVKAFNLNAQELKEVEANLTRIDELGMKEIFNANLKIKYFRNKFMEQLIWCMNHSIPYLNQDQTFASFFDDQEKYAEYTRNVPMENITSTNQAENEVSTEDMSAEDRQVYNEVIENLNYLVLGNPTDQRLAEVVNNACQKVVPAILRQEYKYLSLQKIVISVMFDGLNVTPEEENRISNLISGAFQEEERKLA